MSCTLIWDNGPGEVRTGLVEDGHLTEFRLIRPRHPERALMAAGERYTARILSRLGQGRALATLGFGDDVILQPAPQLPDGSLIAVEMVRAPVPEPGRWKRAVVRLVDGSADAEPCWQFSAEPWELALRALSDRCADIVCRDHAIAASVTAVLGSDGPPVLVDASAIEEADFDGLMDAAATGTFSIPEGELSVERTRAMTMIDVDGTGSALALNKAAAAEIPRLLRLYDIGGPVGIDFISMNSKADRAELDVLLARHCAALGQHERTAINGFGFCQIIRPRPGPSVPEQLCGITPGRLSVESRAIALLREAERSTGIGSRHLVTIPAIADFIRDRPHELAAIKFSLGADVLLVPDSSVSGYGHVHVAQS